MNRGIIAFMSGLCTGEGVELLWVAWAPIGTNTICVRQLSALELSLP